MPKVYDFVDGEISENILYALNQSRLERVSELLEKGHLSANSKAYGLITYKSLKYQYLDSYAKTAESSIRFFLFGDDAPPVPHYTPHDSMIVEALNGMSEPELRVLKETIRLFYSSPIMNADDPSTPSRRFLSILRTRYGGGLPDSVPEEERFKYKKDVMLEVKRYKDAGYVPSFLFNSDYWPDLATLLGISVRWLLGIKEHPLYCNHPLADDIFDMYTLMQPYAKVSFIGMLCVMSSEENPDLEAVFLDRKGV